MSRVLVIGAGVAGLTAALRLAKAGVEVTLVNKGVGGLQLSQGTVDVLGYVQNTRVTAPLSAVEELIASDSGHPYAAIGMDALRAGIQFMREAVGAELLVGEAEANYQLPTAVGAVRPTCLAQPSMIAGACVDGARFVIVGLRRLKDFHPALVAGNLARTVLPDGGRLETRHLLVDVEARAEVDSSGLAYARAFDDADFRARFAAALQPLLSEGETVGLPAVLGLKDRGAWQDVEQRLGHPVFEIPLPPPSVPGMRLNDSLMAAVRGAGVRIVNGSWVQAPGVKGDRVSSVTVGTSGQSREFQADAFLYAPGGFESGALVVDSYGEVKETLFGLPLPAAGGALIHGDYWEEQPLFAVGVSTDASLRPVDADGAPVYGNLHAAGDILGGAFRWREKSGEGIGIGSAVKAADAIVEELS